MRLQTRASLPLAAAGLSAAAVAATAAMIFRSRQHAPKVHGQQDTAWNAAVLSLCPTLTAPYSLPAWLGNGHVETIFAAWFR